MALHVRTTTIYTPAVANWCNVRLVVVGTRKNVDRFKDAARRRIETYFTPDMLEGESRDLSADRMCKAGQVRWQKTYRFQVRNGDGRQHFTRISKQYPHLWFILAFGDPNNDDNGSCLIRNGHGRTFIISNRAKDAVYRKHRHDPDDDSNENENRYWEAQSEMVDIAEQHWWSKIPGARRL